MNEKYKVGSVFYVRFNYFLWMFLLFTSFYMGIIKEFFVSLIFIALSYIVYDEYSFFGRKNIEKVNVKEESKTELEVREGEVV